MIQVLSYLIYGLEIIVYLSLGVALWSFHPMFTVAAVGWVIAKELRFQLTKAVMAHYGKGTPPKGTPDA